MSTLRAMATQHVVHAPRVPVVLKVRTGQCQHLANNIGLAGVPRRDSTVSHEGLLFSFHDNAESLKQSGDIRNLLWLQRSNGCPVWLVDNARICAMQPL